MITAIGNREVKKSREIKNRNTKAYDRAQFPRRNEDRFDRATDGPAGAPQPDPGPASWQASYRRLVADGQAASLTHASEAYQTLLFLRLSRLDSHHYTI